MTTANLRSPELIELLLNSIATQPDGMATSDDVLQIGMNYLRKTHDINDKSAGDTVRWALIYMADDRNWLSRPYGKMDRINYARDLWIRQNRPQQKTKQNVWKITEMGKEHVNILSRPDLDETAKADIEAFNSENEYPEGKKGLRYSSYYERSAALRADSIRKHGVKCSVCGFDFESFYGERGRNYIEVHHVKPISTLQSETFISTEDTTTVCANCHRMIHRNPKNVLSVAELKRIVEQRRQN